MKESLKDIYDAVAICKKCRIEYGYDYPNKCIKQICGKRIKVKEYIDNGLCPQCDPLLSKKLKPKGLNTSDYTNI